MRILLIRVDAPLISFGGTVVDQRNTTEEFPALSMITGLCANALGYDHRDVELLARLQTRLMVGARRDREGERIVDYQTVDLSQDYLRSGWTTDGRVEGREGGSAATGTHIRFRHYIADAVYTIAVTLAPSDESPTLDELASAIDRPARPLHIGRKCCLPSERLVLGVVDCPSLLDALVSVPVSTRAKSGRKLFRVPKTEGVLTAERAITEERDWSNQIHVGRQFVLEGFMQVGDVTAEAEP